MIGLNIKVIYNVMLNKNKIFNFFVHEREAYYIYLDAIKNREKALKDRYWENKYDFDKGIIYFLLGIDDFENGLEEYIVNKYFKGNQ